MLVQLVHSKIGDLETLGLWLANKTLHKKDLLQQKSFNNASGASYNW